MSFFPLHNVYRDEDHIEKRAKRPLDDTTLAAAAARGDQEAFEALFERYKRYVYKLSYKIAFNEEDALDITQNVFAKVALRIGQFDGRGTFRAWLATTTAREAIDFIRSPGRREVPVDPTTLWEVIEPGKERSPRAQYEQTEERQRVEQAMRQLSPQQRAILGLQLLEDLGPKDIAKRLELPPRQVRSQLHRGIKKLKGLLES